MNRKMNNNSSSSASHGSDTVVELELKDDYYDDPDWWKDEDE